MRRSRSEWLLAPLLLLPVVAGIVLLLWARFAYVTEVEPYRLDPAARARDAVDSLGVGAEALRERFLRDFDPASMPPDGARDVPFRVGALRGLLRTTADVTMDGEWVVADGFPGGLTPGALADARVRFEVETGSAPARLEGADAPTRSFADLLAARDLEALRSAPLPAATKLFLVRRWLQDAPDDAALLAADALLSGLRAVDTLLSDLDPATVGIVREGDVAAVAFGPGRPLLVLTQGVQTEKRYAVRPGPTDRVELVWGAPGDGEVVWTDTLARPLAGTWSLVLPYGDRWWATPEFRLWAGVSAAVLLAFLFLPGALLLSIRKQRKLDEARSRFINELAHDLRTPLTSLRLYAEMLAGDRVEETDRGRYTGVIARESGRLSALLANLLDLSRLESGKRIFEAEDLHVTEIADAVVRDFRALYPARAALIATDGDEGTTVHADRTALTRCLANLLDNAGKFTANTTSIRVSWAPHDDGVRIVVEDDGPGIAEAERARLFSRYARGKDAMKNGVPGTGLGLSLVRELTEGMGGTATLLETDAGAAFELILPGGNGA